MKPLARSSLAEALNELVFVDLLFYTRIGSPPSAAVIIFIIGSVAFTIGGAIDLLALLRQKHRVLGEAPPAPTEATRLVGSAGGLMRIEPRAAALYPHGCPGPKLDVLTTDQRRVATCGPKPDRP